MNQESTIQENEIGRTFGRKAGIYHNKAEVQKKAAEGLIASLKPWKAIIPHGPVLEIGAGTGLLSELLIPEFKNKNILITDLSQDMLDQCKNNLKYLNLVREGVDFRKLDVNNDSPQARYSLIVSNFAAQWFDDPALAFEKLSDHLLPGGILLSSFPGEKSFPQWHQKCLELGLPFTANELPNVEKVGIHLSMGPVQIDFFENEISQKFNSSIGFFRHLKELGADYSKGNKRMRADQFRLLTRYWDSSVDEPEITWHVAYLAVKKDA